MTCYVHSDTHMYGRCSVIYFSKKFKSCFSCVTFSSHWRHRWLAVMKKTLKTSTLYCLVQVWHSVSHIKRRKYIERESEQRDEYNVSAYKTRSKKRPEKSALRIFVLCYLLHIWLRSTNWKQFKWTKHVARIKRIKAYRVLVWIPEDKLFRWSTRGKDNNIKKRLTL